MATKETEMSVKNGGEGIPSTDREKGLTEAQVAKARMEWGPNEIEIPEVSIYSLLFEEFTTTMAITLEIACVLSLALLDWADFGIVAGMILCNALIGFHEKIKAKRALESLTGGQESRCSVKRDGVSRDLPIRDIVPGDLVCLAGGMEVPADCVWVSGDEVLVNTKAVTGESVPRKFGGNNKNHSIKCGCEIVANTCYAVVTATGEHTEVGQSSKQIADDKTTVQASVFETNVMRVVKIIIGLAFLDVIFLVVLQGFVREGFKDNWHDPILMALSLIVAAIPVALPLVLQVTFALGASVMAREHNAIVMSSSALSDIAAMTTLCSDKTGTLTTANMSILNDRIRCFSGATVSDVLLYARLVSNPDKKDDPIDRATIVAYEKEGPSTKSRFASYEKISYESFNATVKRVTGTFREKDAGKTYVVSKGILSKILDTSSGGKDEGRTQWRVEGLEKIKSEVEKVDLDLSKAGYKTIAVAVGVDGGPMRFVGILPIIDPPRHDTAAIVAKIHGCGVGMKMITGDHGNIAAETARLVGLNTSILDGAESRGGDHVTKQRILEAGGFAEVTMNDKRNVVMTLEKDFGLVVGMMGDGVNDAPALSCANCGIAVDGATDAAKNAADIILTEPGLSAIYHAIVESRRIFSRLTAYVTYRLAATTQIVLLLTVLVVAFDCEIKPLYVILLAFLNDVTMTPISVDRAEASAAPIKTDMTSLVGLALTFGLAETLASVIFFVLSRDYDGFLDGVDADAGDDCGDYLQASVFLQVMGAAELLIFSARSPGLLYLSAPPSMALLSSTMIGNVFITILCAEVSYFGALSWRDIGVIWAYNIAVLLVVDVIKMIYKLMSSHDTAGVIVDDKGEDEEATTTEDKRSIATAAATKEEDNETQPRKIKPFLSRSHSKKKALARFLSCGALERSVDIHDRNASLRWRTERAVSRNVVARGLRIAHTKRRGLIVPRRLSV
eukprot:g4465.t1